MAEKEGFEPPVPFLAQLISSQSHSATLPLLLRSEIEKRFKSAWQALTEICHMFCFARDRSGRRGTTANFSSRRFLVDKGGFIHTVRC